MKTLAKFMIIAGADNCPPMLEKSMYDSWKSCMELYMENRENRRLILNSVQNGPPGLPPDVYAIVNHHKVAKEIWDRVKLRMQGKKGNLIEEEMAYIEAKSTTRKIVTNDQAKYYSRIISITVNGKNAYELKGKLLDDLHKNAFIGTNGEDMVEHIEYFLKIIDPINLSNVNQDKLRVVVFPISLVGDAWKWFDGIKGSITSWVDLTGKFFGKYYLPSCTGKVNTPIIKWDPTNPKFKNWLASKFVNYKTMDIFTKGALWDYWKLGSDEIEPTNNETSDLEETNHDDEQEIAKIFRIETNLFDYETPLCEKFKEFNYLLKIDPDFLTKDIEGFKTYDEYKDDWIYE
ncbi:hypothetical protein Tco_0541259 [Tanacetum coccineum]